jgi:hypothetical protein
VPVRFTLSLKWTKRLLIHWIFDVLEHLNFRKKQVISLRQRSTFQVFRLAETANAEAGSNISRWTRQNYAAAHHECSHLLIRPNAMSPSVCVKVKQHDAYNLKRKEPHRRASQSNSHLNLRSKAQTKWQGHQSAFCLKR